MKAKESRKDEIWSQRKEVRPMASSQSWPEEAEVSGVAGADAVEDGPDDGKDAPAPQQDPYEEMPAAK